MLNVVTILTLLNLELGLTSQEADAVGPACATPIGIASSDTEERASVCACCAGGGGVCVGPVPCSSTCGSPVCPGFPYPCIPAPKPQRCADDSPELPFGFMLCLSMRIV